MVGLALNSKYFELIPTFFFKAINEIYINIDIRLYQY